MTTYNDNFIRNSDDQLDSVKFIGVFGCLLVLRYKKPR